MELPESLQSPDSVKLVMVGDAAVGKSAFLIWWTTGVVPEQYVPTIYDSYCVISRVDDQPITAELWDTAGMEEFDEIRHQHYQSIDIVVICFSLVSTESFDKVQSKWFPEVRHHHPHIPIVLLGLKCDLRSKEDEQVVASDNALQLAKVIGAVGYYETSIKTGAGVTEATQAILRAGLRKVWKEREEKNSDLSAEHSQSVVESSFCYNCVPLELPANEMDVDKYSRKHLTGAEGEESGDTHV